MNNLYDELRLLRYLLGDLPDEELDEIEELYLEDSNLFEQLVLVEDDLIDDYVRGELSPHDRKLFEMNYLISPGRKEKVANAIAVGAYLSRESKAKAEKPIQGGGLNLWQKLRAFILRRKLMFELVFAASVAAAAGVIWLIPGPASNPPPTLTAEPMAPVIDPIYLKIEIGKEIAISNGRPGETEYESTPQAERKKQNDAIIETEDELRNRKFKKFWSIEAKKPSQTP
jgi:voltage-gated potassium channel Kch